MSQESAARIRALGRRLYGPRYIVPMARAMRTTPDALRRWSRTGGPADMPQRLEAMLRRRMASSLRCSAWCARTLTRIAQQADLDDIARAGRLQALLRDLYD